MAFWISLDEAKDYMTKGTGKGVKIAIIDSGVEISHPDLAGLKLVDDIAVLDNGLHLDVVPGDGHDVYGHGTAVAGIIRKLAPDAEIGSFRVLGPNLGSRTVIIREGVRQALDRGYNILNCSFGCGLEEHLPSYKSWIDEAYLKGVHVVAACNNMDFTKPEYPGYFPSVIAVNFGRASDDEAFFYRPGNLVEFAARGRRSRGGLGGWLAEKSDGQQLCHAPHRRTARADALRVSRTSSAPGESRPASTGAAVVDRNRRR